MGKDVGGGVQSGEADALIVLGRFLEVFWNARSHFRIFVLPSLRASIDPSIVVPCFMLVIDIVSGLLEALIEECCWYRVSRVF